MSSRINMPKLGMTMTEGTIDEWYKSVGDEVKKGEAVCMIASEKLTLDVEAPEDGILTEITVEAGGRAKVGEQMGLVGDSLEDNQSPERSNQSTDDEAISESGEETNERAAIKDAAEKSPSFNRSHEDELNKKARDEDTPTSQSNSESNRIFITPLARRIAESNDISIEEVTGTGGNGRITKRDIEKAIDHVKVSSTTESTEATQVTAEGKPLSNMRRAIADNMMHSLQSTAQLTLHQKVEADALLKFNKKLKKEVSNNELDIKVTITALITKAVALVLKDDARMNATYSDEKLYHHKDVNIGIATSLEDGLMVPVIHNAESKSIGEISIAIETLSAAARNGELSQGAMKDGTFTITNIGAGGIEYFTPVLNAPEVGILGVGSLQSEVALKDGKPYEKKMLPLSLTIDHQIIDGADGAEFLSRIKTFIEHPYLLIL